MTTTSLLDRQIYSFADVDRLVGLHSGTARRWIDGYSRAGVHYPPGSSSGADGRGTGDVGRDPGRSFGQPAVRSVRTEILAEEYRAGANREHLAELYELSPEQVDDALRYEMTTSSQQAA